MLLMFFGMIVVWKLLSWSVGMGVGRFLVVMMFVVVLLVKSEEVMIVFGFLLECRCSVYSLMFMIRMMVFLLVV